MDLNLVMMRVLFVPVTFHCLDTTDGRKGKVKQCKYMQM
jgi:hypothetical protein